MLKKSLKSMPVKKVTTAKTKTKSPVSDDPVKKVGKKGYYRSVRTGKKGRKEGYYRRFRSGKKGRKEGYYRSFRTGKKGRKEGYYRRFRSG